MNDLASVQPRRRKAALITDDAQRPGLLRFTEVRPCVVAGWPDAHTAWLVVDGQQFCITPIAAETKEDAEWFCERLATALGKIIESA